jgi:hypothetical protein
MSDPWKIFVPGAFIALTLSRQSADDAAHSLVAASNFQLSAIIRQLSAVQWLVEMLPSLSGLNRDAIRLADLTPPTSNFC